MIKRAVTTYSFINAKLKAKIGKIKDDRLEDDLLNSGSLVEAVGILREHGYIEAAETFDKTGDLQMVELSLLKDLIADYQSVQKLTEGFPKELVTIILLKIEVENIKNTIRLWYSAAVHHRPITYRTSYLIKQKIVNNIDYIALTNAISYKNIIDALAGTWYQNVLRKFSFEDISRDGLFELETAIDKYWYSLYIDACSFLKGDDKEVANRMAMIEINLKNTLMLVRYGWFHKMDAKKLQNSLFPYGSVYTDKVTHDYINSNPKKRDPDILLNNRYPEIAEKVKEVNVTDNKAAMINQTRFIEKFLEEKKQKSFQKILGGKPFTIGIPLAYFYFRESQYYMICGILGGKYYGVDSSEIKGILS